MLQGPETWKLTKPAMRAMEEVGAHQLRMGMLDSSSLSQNKKTRPKISLVQKYQVSCTSMRIQNRPIQWKAWKD